MGSRGFGVVRYEMVAPGARLATLFSNLDFSLRASEILKISLDELARIYNGDIEFPHSISRLLEEYYGTPVCVWQKLEANYRRLVELKLASSPEKYAEPYWNEIVWLFNDDYAPSATRHFVDIMKERGLDEKDCARLLDVTNEDFSHLLIGELPFKTLFAEKCEIASGILAEYWVKRDKE